MLVTITIIKLVAIVFALFKKKEEFKILEHLLKNIFSVTRNFKIY